MYGKLGGGGEHVRLLGKNPQNYDCLVKFDCVSG